MKNPGNFRDRTLVIDFDGTLAFSDRQSLKDITYPIEPIAILPMDRDGSPGKTALFIRPYAYEFLHEVNAKYKLVLWTYGDDQYITHCLSKTRFKPYFQRVISRKHVSAPIKDLFALEQDLTRIAIIDDSNDPFGLLNPYNCIDIPSWSAGIVGDLSLRAISDLVDLHFQRVLLEHSVEDLISLRGYILNALRSSQTTSSSDSNIV